METNERGYRVRVQYPVLIEYRYLAWDEEGWLTTCRSGGKIFETRDAADKAIPAFLAMADVSEIHAITKILCEIEPIPEFDPDWVTKPGSHIREHMESKGLTLQEFAGLMEMTPEDAHKLLESVTEIDEAHAKKLEVVLGASDDYWLNLEEVYRKGLKMGLTVTQ